VVGIRDPEKNHPGFRGVKKHRIPDPDPQHWREHYIFLQITCRDKSINVCWFVAYGSGWMSQAPWSGSAGRLRGGAETQGNCIKYNIHNGFFQCFGSAYIICGKRIQPCWQMRILIQIQAKSEHIFFRVKNFFCFVKLVPLSHFLQTIFSQMCFWTIPFYDELSVFLLRFPPQFRLILHLLDPVRNTGFIDWWVTRSQVGLESHKNWQAPQHEF
jgi:hypothetical protein